jgi:hypothetical protein
MAESSKTISVELKGADDVLEKIGQALIAARQQAAGGLYRVAEEMIAESKQRVPVDTGALKNSGHVQGPDESPGGVSVTLGYGGPSAGYAIIVHEDLEALHRVGEAKFLESVVREYAPTLLDRVAKGITL